MNFNLKNKKVFITGSSGGIGSAICNKFIQMGSTIILTSSDKNKIKDLKNTYGPKNYYYFLDLSDSKNLSFNVNKIVKEHPDINILINNAGITDDNLFLRMKPEQWNNVIDVNLNSHFYLIKEILPYMIKNKKGSIIGISSVVSSTGNPGQANYTASKAGMTAMYKSLSLEVSKRNIRVNLIAPGFIQTPMTNKLNEVQKNNIMDSIPMKRFGTPNDVANMVIFLSSDFSSYITGQTIHVNGGLLML